ncbi:MAG: DUF342 domain-containing protein [Deltaproteobacteria bacterium]|nr:DUF342 domain-containing protein [Deltaproteobacteria bacterium]
MDAASGVIAGRVEHESYTFDVELVDGGLECRCSLEPKGAGSFINDSNLLDLLNRCGIRQGIDLEAVSSFTRNACSGKPQKEVPLARGMRAEPGRDGWVEFIVRPHTGLAEYKEDEDGVIDFHNPHSFTNVQPGAEIALLHPAEEGRQGVLVTGSTVPAPAVKPIRLTIGRGIRLEEDGKKIIATAEGRVVYDGNTVSVESGFVVNGDVDYEIGNIDFAGFVDVRGDVLDGFKISSTKGIKVSGNAGNCQIRSGGNITIGGMSGQGKGAIVCTGNLFARFLNEVVVECGGNVTVESEIRNSRIRSGACIIVPKGVISGGECIALSGIEAGTLGSPIGVRTVLASGGDRSSENANAKINVRKRVLEGVVLCLGDTTEEIQAEMDGPVSVIEDSQERRLQSLPLTPLTVNARRLEAALKK